MRNETLWEAICSLAGPSGEEPVSIEAAIARSAVNEGIAEVEIRQFSETNLIRRLADDQVQLTVNGRANRETQHHSSDVVDILSD